MTPGKVQLHLTVFQIQGLGTVRGSAMRGQALPVSAPLVTSDIPPKVLEGR